MNVTKISLTRCQIFHLKCTKFNFGWGRSQRSPRPSSWIWGGKRKSEGKKKGGDGG